MKKKIILHSGFLFMALIAITAQCCNTAAPKANEASEAGMQVAANEESAIEVYYFHATRRCATCNAVEEVTKAALAEKYGDTIRFFSINREEEKDHPLIKQHQLNGQTLLIIKGDKAENLTNYAFMNARTHPDRLKDKLIETIAAL